MEKKLGVMRKDILSSARRNEKSIFPRGVSYIKETSPARKKNDRRKNTKNKKLVFFSTFFFPSPIEELVAAAGG